MSAASQDDLRSDPDLPEGIRYDPDLAVHEPVPVPSEPLAPSRRRAPLLFLPIGLLALSLLIYALFGLIAHEGKRSSDYLDEVRLQRATGWQAAFELSRLLPIEDPRRRDDRFAPQLISLLEASRGEDPRVRRYLTLCLGEIKDPRSLEALEGALTDEDLQTRIYAAWGLGALQDARAVPALLPLLDSDEADLRKIGAYALGALHAPQAIGRLRELLNDPVEDVAWNAALALARQQDAAGLPTLARMLDRAYLDGVRRPDEAGRPRPLGADQKEEAILNAVRSLAGLGDKQHLATLRSLRDSDPSLLVRQAAREALEALER